MKGYEQAPRVRIVSAGLLVAGASVVGLLSTPRILFVELMLAAAAVIIVSTLIRKHS